MQRRELGTYLEQCAEEHLLSQGMRILHRNFTCKQGEVDIVGVDGAQYVFAEVRGRSQRAFGHPAETVHRHKQKKIIAAATHYIRKYPQAINCRFDVVAISFQQQHGKISIQKVEWLKNAFSLDGWSF